MGTTMTKLMILAACIVAVSASQTDGSGSSPGPRRPEMNRKRSNLSTNTQVSNGQGDFAGMDIDLPVDYPCPKCNKETVYRVFGKKCCEYKCKCGHVSKTMVF